MWIGMECESVNQLITMTMTLLTIKARIFETHWSSILKRRKKTTREMNEGKTSRSQQDILNVLGRNFHFKRDFPNLIWCSNEDDPKWLRRAFIQGNTRRKMKRFKSDYAVSCVSININHAGSLVRSSVERLGSFCRRTFRHKCSRNDCVGILK